MTRSTRSFPVLHHIPGLAQTHVQSVMPSNHLILCCPLLLLPSIFPSIRVFSNESVICIRWPKYWIFSYQAPNNITYFLYSKIFFNHEPGVVFLISFIDFYINPWYFLRNLILLTYILCSKRCFLRLPCWSSG